MNLLDIKAWARSIKVTDYPEKDRARISCYLDMILEKAGVMEKIAEKLSGYNNDILEYIKQLDKLKVVNEVMPNNKPEVLEEKIKSVKEEPANDSLLPS